MRQANIQVRCQCQRCGIQSRVDVEALALKLGPTANLVDRLDRCTIVGCHGHAFYLAAKTYGRAWLALLDRRQISEDAAPARNAETIERARRSN